MWADKRRVEFEFAGNDLIAGDSLKLTWLDGGIEPDRNVVKLPASLTNFPASGGFWIGEHGAIFKPYGVRPFVMPEADFPAEKYPRGIKPQDHYLEWVDAILNGTKSCGDFGHGGPLTETVVVGTIADRFPNQWLEWDRAGLKFTNLEAANALVKREYRDGWKIEGLG